MVQLKDIFTKIPVVVFMQLMLSAQPLLAHSEHLKETSPPERSPQPSEQPQEIQQPIESPAAETSKTHTSQPSTPVISHRVSSGFSFLPQPAEALFLLLVATPLLLFFLKDKLKN